MSVHLRVLSRSDCEHVRQWRNQDIRGFRTNHLLTVENQEKFYDNVVCNPGVHRYWGLGESTSNYIAGMVGLTNIDFVNGYAEISLIINPALHKMGFGRIAVTLALGEAFNNLRLDTVIGEVYECNPAIHFWRKIVKERDGYSTRLPRRKWHDGMLWDSMYFSFSVNDTPAEKL